MKTNELRKLIKSQLDTICTSYYSDAPEDAMFPHVVFDFTSIELNDMFRQDYSIGVDVWHKNNQANAEEIADEICELFRDNNLPQQIILPTFYRESRKNVIDDDKEINHIQMTFIVQTYDNN